MVEVSSLAPSEDYASAGDLLAADDRPHVTLRVWGKPIRVRGLTLEEREIIRAGNWLPDGQRDTPAMVAEFLRLGFVAPTLDAEQARQFVRKHAGSVEQIYLFIDKLTELDYDTVVAQARALAGLARGSEPLASGDGAGAPAGDSTSDGPVDQPGSAAAGDEPAGAAAPAAPSRAAGARRR